MNRVRVRPIRSYTGRIQVFAVELAIGQRWREIAAYKSWSRAHDFANSAARAQRLADRVNKSAQVKNLSL